MSSHSCVVDVRKSGLWIFGCAVVVAVASGIYVFLDDRGEPGVRFGILALIMLGTRWGNVPAPFAAAFACFMLLATWASVEHWYRDIRLADEVIHFLTPGSMAAALYFLLVNFRMMPGPRESRAHLRSWVPVFWVMIVGVFAAVLWEYYEWVVEQFNPSGMRVGYTDTVLDLVAGTLGSLTAGLLVLWWAHRHDREPTGR